MVVSAATKATVATAAMTSAVKRVTVADARKVTAGAVMTIAVKREDMVEVVKREDTVEGAKKADTVEVARREDARKNMAEDVKRAMAMTVPAAETVDMVKMSAATKEVVTVEVARTTPTAGAQAAGTATATTTGPLAAKEAMARAHQEATAKVRAAEVAGLAAELVRDWTLTAFAAAVSPAGAPSRTGRQTGPGHPAPPG